MMEGFEADAQRAVGPCDHFYAGETSAVGLSKLCPLCVLGTIERLKAASVAAAQAEQWGADRLFQARAEMREYAADLKLLSAFRNEEVPASFTEAWMAGIQGLASVCRVYADALKPVAPPAPPVVESPPCSRQSADGQPSPYSAT